MTIDELMEELKQMKDKLGTGDAKVVFGMPSSYYAEGITGVETSKVHFFDDDEYEDEDEDSESNVVLISTTQVGVVL